MAYKARTLLDVPNKPNAYRGVAAPREVAGVNLTGRLQMFPGEPPREMLEDDLVEVCTLTGPAWPRSSCDRNAKAAHVMRLRVEDGTWPTEREKALQEFAEAKLEDPDHVGRSILKDQGLRPDEIEKVMARAKATTKGIPVVALKKRGPGRPPKSETA